MIESTLRTQAPAAAPTLGGLQAAFGTPRIVHPQAAPRVVAGLFDLREWQPWLEPARIVLDDREAARVARCHADADRRARVLAYAFHRLLLGALLDIQPAAVPLARDGNGKPVVEGHPIHTSLSHSAPFVAVAACTAGPVGIDLEPSLRSGVMHEIAGQVCHPDEARSLAPLAPPARARSLLSLWVRKEALLKAAGIGLAREMSSFVAATPPGAASRVQMLEAGPACVAAIAGPPGVPVDWAWVRPCAMEARACAA